LFEQPVAALIENSVILYPPQSYRFPMRHCPGLDRRHCRWLLDPAEDFSAAVDCSATGLIPSSRVCADAPQLPASPTVPIRNKYIYVVHLLATGIEAHTPLAEA
jgi:hypothetical protein